MLTPEYLLHIAEGAEEIAEELHVDIINRIVERIMVRLDRGDDYVLTPLDKWQMEVLQDAGILYEDILKEIARKTGKQQTEIKEAMEDACVTNMRYEDELYRAAGIITNDFTQSPYMMRLMQRAYEATLGEWNNFTRTTANAAQRAYINACDRAYHLVSSGAVSYTQAVKEAVNSMVTDGVIVEYPSGHKDTIETATLRAVRTGVSQASAQITVARMDEYGEDLVLVSSHLGARPEHFLWQGKVYSRSGTNPKYPDFVQSTRYGYVDGLCGANCRHNFSVYFEGMPNPFEKFDAEENQKRYDTEQRQRAMERRIRDTKRKTMGLKTAMDNAKTPEARAEFEMEYQRKAALLQKQNKAYREFCETNNLKTLNDRLSIARWDRKQAAAARGAAKKWNNRSESMAKIEKQFDKSRESDIIKNRAEDINSVNYEEGRGIQRVISNILRTEETNINLDGLPIQAQRYALTATRKICDKFPQLKGYTRKIIYDPDLKSIASSKSLTGIIKVGPDFMDIDQLRKAHIYSVKIKNNPKGTDDPISIFVHEYGHQLDGYLTQKGIYGGSISQSGVTRTSVNVQREVLKRSGLTDERLREIRKKYIDQGFSGERLNHAVRFERNEFIEQHLSSYACTNSNEFFAEAFSEYIMSKEPRKLAKTFGEILQEIMEGIE